jgi:hypothetical protein
MRTYSNRDFYLSAYLISEGYKLASHLRNDGITTFQFTADENIEDAVNNYYSMKAMVSPLAYSSAIRSLKTVIHSSNSNSINNNGRNTFNKS